MEQETRPRIVVDYVSSGQGWVLRSDDRINVHPLFPGTLQSPGNILIDSGRRSAYVIADDGSRRRLSKEQAKRISEEVDFRLGGMNTRQPDNKEESTVNVPAA